jgi:hypothetical protein
MKRHHLYRAFCSFGRMISCWDEEFFVLLSMVLIQLFISLIISDFSSRASLTVESARLLTVLVVSTLDSPLCLYLPESTMLMSLILLTSPSSSFLRSEPLRTCERSNVSSAVNLGRMTLFWPLMTLLR